jgi:hypothetical protein
MRPQLFSGARGKITFTDPSGKETPLAFVTSVSVSVNDGLRPVFVIGNMNPSSIEPVSYDISGSIGRIIPLNASDAKASKGTESANAKTTAIDYNIESAINQILQLDDCSIQIYDKESAAGDVIVETIMHVRFAGRNTSVNSGDIASESYSFVGILSTGNGGTENAATALGYGVDKTT